MTYNPSVVMLIIVLVAIILIYYVLRYAGRKKMVKDVTLTEDDVDRILMEKVGFYKQLNEEDKIVFVKRVLYFLKTTKISAEKGAIITDADRVLVAASGTIPLFHFKNWAYENLEEVLIYPDTFTEKFSIEDDKRNVLGMVGTGALNHKMILSLGALRAGFSRRPEGNTAIHEFVHLIDKADGEIDGIPEYLIPKSLMQPWLQEMEKTILEIVDGESEIRHYATTNEAEFLAVVSEYFFKKPDMLQQDHPELYALLDQMYNQKSTI